MQRNVQITRTVSFDKIPNHIAEMLAESQAIFNRNVDNSFRTLEESVSEKNFISFLENLETFRMELAKADMILEDCRNIMTGYADLIINPDSQSEQNQAQKQPPGQNVDMGELLSNWKENVESHIENLKEKTNTGE